MQKIIDIENKHTSGTYAKQPLVIVRGQGASLFDADGVEYIDCSSGHGVANLGHAHPKIAEALYYWHVKPNDTIFLELSKRESIKKKEATTGMAPEITNNDVVLQFVTKHGTTPFPFDKRKKLKQLLEGLLKEATNVLVLTHGQVAKLQVKGDTVPNTEMGKTIAQYGLIDGDDVSIGIKSYVTFKKTYPKVTFHFDGLSFDKPSLYLNSNPVGLDKSSSPSNTLSVTEGI